MKATLKIATGQTATEALAAALEAGHTLNKYADPSEGERTGLTLEEAIEVAEEDAGLIYLA